MTNGKPSWGLCSDVYTFHYRGCELCLGIHTVRVCVWLLGHLAGLTISKPKASRVNFYQAKNHPRWFFFSHANKTEVEEELGLVSHRIPINSHQILQ